MVEQVLSKARHYLMRFHRPAKLKLERWHGFLIKQHASPLGGACFLFFRISEVNGMDAGSQASVPVKHALSGLLSIWSLRLPRKQGGI